MACNCGNNGSCGMQGDGCPINLSSMCVYYQGNISLDKINAVRGERLESILRNINEKFKILDDQVLEGFFGENVGGGVKIYKGLKPNTNVGEIRTLVGSSSVLVDNTADTISFSVKDSYIKDLLDPIKDGNSSLTTRIEAIEKEQASQNSIIQSLEVEQDKHTVALKGLEEKHTAVESDLASLHTKVSNNATDITALQARDKQHDSDIAQLRADISDIQQRIAPLGYTHRESHPGQKIFETEKEILEIIGIYVSGVLIPTDAYTFDSPNRVAILTSVLGFAISSDDRVDIVYNVKV